MTDTQTELRHYNPAEPLQMEKPIDIQESDVTIVFGQGPVQSYDENYVQKDHGDRSLPARKGLNVFSRLNALAAAEMLIAGKTHEVIVSGGATGPDISQTEGDLMAQAIIKRLRATGKQSEDGNTITYRIGGKEQTIPSEKAEAFLNGFIHIENKANDTLENFVYSLNQYVDRKTDGNGTPQRVTLLGASFHAYDTSAHGGEGRLQKLAKIFQLEGQTVSAEDILNSLQVMHDPLPLQRITNMTHNHEVAQLKSLQEVILNEKLEAGEWLTRAAKLDNPERLRSMLRQHMKLLPELTEDQLNSAQLEELQRLALEGGTRLINSEEMKELSQKYDAVKGQEVFARLERLRDERIQFLLQNTEIGAAVKQQLGLDDNNLDTKVVIEKANVRLYDIKLQLGELNKKIEEARERKDENEITKLLNERTVLAQARGQLETLLKEDRYKTETSYLMQYGKGSDPRTQS